MGTLQVDTNTTNQTAINLVTDNLEKVECYVECVYRRQQAIQKILAFINDERSRKRGYQDGRNDIVEERAETVINRLDVKIRSAQLMGQFFYMSMSKKDIPGWL